MNTEYMVYGMINGKFFRDFYKHEETAREEARKFKVWHKESRDTWCKLALCTITEIED